MQSLVKKIAQKPFFVNTFYVIFLLMIFSLLIFSRQLNDLDEIWNFSNGLNIFNGLVPYKEFNMVATPFSGFLTAAFIFIFGKNLTAMRLLTVILSVLISILSYKILRQFGISRRRARAYVVVSAVLFNSIFIYNYNFLNLFFIMLLIYLQIVHYKVITPKMEILIGFIAGLCVITKQTTGAFVCLSIAIISVICFKKDFWKSWLLRMAGGITVLAVFAIYLIVTDSYYDFYDFTIAGISDFTNSISYINYITEGDIVDISSGVLLPVIIIIFAIKCYKQRSDKRFSILLLTAVSGCIVIYPICDMAHVFCAAYPIFICVALLINNKLQINSKVVLSLYLILIYTFALIVPMPNILAENMIICQHEGFKGIPINIKLNDEISTVKQYIKSQEEKGRNVIICDASAEAFMIPCGRYNFIYDMPDIGNFGSKSPLYYAKKLTDMDNTDVLILHNKDELNWQFPLEMRTHIISTLDKSGKIGRYDIYTKP